MRKSLLLFIALFSFGVHGQPFGPGQTSGGVMSKPASGGSGDPVDLTSGVTGTLPITSGGSGQSSKASAFNALSPLSTKGDLIVSDGTNNIRFPVCDDDEVMVADATEDSGWVCGTAGGSGDVVGPASATDDSLARFDSTTGKLIQDSSGVTLSDAGLLTLNGGTNQIRLAGDAGKIYFNNGTNSGIKLNNFGFDFFVNNGSEAPRFRITQSELTHTGNATILGVLGQVLSYRISTPTGIGFNHTSDLTLAVGDQGGTSQARTAGDLTLKAGDNASSDNTATAGTLSVRAGDQTSASSTIKAPSATLRAGNNAGSGDGGDLQLSGGSSGSGDDGIVVIGSSSTTPTHRLNISTETAGANAATLTNSPAAAGNPDLWIRINFNGTDYVMPAWEAP